MNRQWDFESEHSGHRLRLREKADRVGLEHMPGHEVLEIVLFSIFPRGNTNEIAHALMEEFGSVRNVLSATEVELMCVRGIGKRAAEVLCAYGRAVRAYAGLTRQRKLLIRTRRDAVNFAEQIFNEEVRPQTWILLVDHGGSVIYLSRIYAGAMWLTDETRGFIAGHALMYHAHYAAILAWRGFDLKGIFPTDRRMIHELAESLNGIGVTVLDYLVVTPWRTVSLRRDVEMEPNDFFSTGVGQAVREDWLSDSRGIWEAEAGERVDIGEWSQTQHERVDGDVSERQSRSGSAI